MSRSSLETPFQRPGTSSHFPGKSDHCPTLSSRFDNFVSLDDTLWTKLNLELFFSSVSWSHVLDFRLKMSQVMEVQTHFRLKMMFMKVQTQRGHYLTEKEKKSSRKEVRIVKGTKETGDRNSQVHCGTTCNHLHCSLVKVEFVWNKIT